MAEQPATPNTPFGLWKAYALLCLGYALCFCASPLSPVGTAALFQNGIEQQGLILTRMVFLIAAALGIHLEARQPKSHGLISRPYIPVSGLAGCGAFIVLYQGHALGFDPWSAICYACLLGCALGSIMPQWNHMFSEVYKKHGRVTYIAVFSCPFIISTGLAALVTPTGQNPALSEVLVLLIAAECWTCFEHSSHNPMFKQDQKPTIAESFTPTRYTRAIAISSGITWALAYNLAPSLGFASYDFGVGPALLLLLAYALCQGTVVLIVWRAGIGQTHFGLILRWFIAIIGIGWALMPILIALMPRSGCFAAVIMFLIQNVLIGLFIVELSLESHYEVTDVFGHVALLFIAAACGTSLLYWTLQEFVVPVRPDIVIPLITAVAMTASLLILPLLPSRGSSVQVFTLERLPENEPIEVARRQAKATFMSQCSLTPRESQVLDCLLEGLPHEETAAQLGISTWTVRNHARSIYTKTGTHSVKELMALVYGEKQAE